ncbi:MAG: YdiU family protein [Betaproteobacteria bacterium]|nr:YdiU family protein [Betaproteobacteria bacterium]
MSFTFDNSFARELPGFYVKWQPEQVPEPRLLYLNHGLAEELRLDPRQHDAATFAAMLSGNRFPEGAEPIAQVYAGHQFGHFSPQLGDGRALLLGEVIDRHGQRRDIAFKGSGPTPIARGGDGKAAVGPMLREVLIGEAMHALGIPTTRALAVVTTGESVHREKILPGATLTRVAVSHIRVGSFEYHAARGDRERVRQLADYAIARHDPGLTGTKGCYLDFLCAVMERQAALVAQWMGVGFIHGVMNTDNMSIAGETIDYGPCAFMEAYDPETVFSSIDKLGRYAYQHQPGIALWNLARLAESLLPLLADDAEEAVALATDVIAGFHGSYRRHWLGVLRTKMGLNGRVGSDDDDIALAEEWLALLQNGNADFTLAWRYLAHAADGNPAPLRSLFADHRALDAWLPKWQARCAAEDACTTTDESRSAATARAQSMRRVNPWLIPRNHCVEEALSAASDENDLGPFEQLLAALGTPYDENVEFARYAPPAPASFTAAYCTFCGT